MFKQEKLKRICHNGQQDVDLVLFSIIFRNGKIFLAAKQKNKTD